MGPCRAYYQLHVPLGGPTPAGATRAPTAICMGAGDPPDIRAAGYTRRGGRQRGYVGLSGLSRQRSKIRIIKHDILARPAAKRGRRSTTHNTSCSPVWASIDTFCTGSARTPRHRSKSSEIPMIRHWARRPGATRRTPGGSRRWLRLRCYTLGKRAAVSEHCKAFMKRHRAPAYLQGSSTCSRERPVFAHAGNR